jgi:hypothetical protein
MMSGFSYQDSDSNIKTVPVMYGDLTRQVASILRDNSENKIPTAPRMSVYVTDLALDTDRLADSSYVNKVNIRERAFDEQGNEYLNSEGRNYTVERIMPTPYTLTVSVDIWTTNTDQKLQLLEQILMLFNPSLEIQTTDNYLDWTSLSVVNLDSVTWSSRTIPQGTESEIDVSTLTFTTPIWVSPPAKVKRMGVVTNIISRIHNSKQDLFDETSDIDTGIEQGSAESKTGLFINEAGDLEAAKTVKGWQTGGATDSIIKTAYQNLDLLVINNTMKLIKNGVPGAVSWLEYLAALPGEYEEGVSTINLQRADTGAEIVGTFAVSPANETEAVINWDIDTIPTDTVIPGANGARSNIDYIIDPLKSNPQDLGLSANPRILLLGSIGDPQNSDGADAWKNLNGTDFVAEEYDIVEWTGSEWQRVFVAAEAEETPVFVTNLNTGIQYKFDGAEWLLSFEGEYQQGTWRIDF